MPKKGYDRLLRSGDERYTIVFVGGETPAGLEGDDRFAFLGTLPQSRLADVYRACDLFVAPSVGEGLTLTMIEAMASGLPLVTNRNSKYLPRDLDPDGIMLLPPSGDDLRMTLAGLLGDRAALERMSAYSLQLVAERHSWPAHTNALLRVYASIGLTP